MIKSWPKYISAKNDNGHKKTMAIKNWPKMNTAKNEIGQNYGMAKGKAWPDL